MFALIWSVGICGDGAARDSFNQFLRALACPEGEGKKILKVPFPEQGTIYDYAFDKERVKWKSWADTVPNYSVSSTARFHDIIVPTTENIRFTYANTC